MTDERVKVLNDVSDWAICAANNAKTRPLAAGFLDVALQTHSLAALLAATESPGDIPVVQSVGRSLTRRMGTDLLILKGQLDRIKSAPEFRRVLDIALAEFKRERSGR